MNKHFFALAIVMMYSATSLLQGKGQDAGYSRLIEENGEGAQALKPKRGQELTFSLHNADEKHWWYAVVPKSDFERYPKTFARPTSTPSIVDPGEKAQLPIDTDTTQLLILFRRPVKKFFLKDKITGSTDAATVYVPMYIYELGPSTRHFVQFGFDPKRHKQTLIPQKTGKLTRNIDRSDIKLRKDLTDTYGRGSISMHDEKLADAREYMGVRGTVDDFE